MPLLNFFFWFLLAALATLVFALLNRLKRQEAADLAYLAQLSMVWQEQDSTGTAKEKAAG